MSKSEHNEFYRNKTRFQEQNILNLAYGQFDGDGKYDMPIILPAKDLNYKEIPLQGFNFAATSKRKEFGVHFFLHDYQFERVWNNPYRYAEMLSQFEYVLSPDFSPYGNMPRATQIFNVYRNRWCARYWQEQGINVVPTFTYGDESMFDYIFDGLPVNSTIAVSTMGEGRWGNYKSLIGNWDKVIDRLKPKQVILYGKDLSKELSGTEIIYKPLTNVRIM